jgi:phosphatidylinositol alpha-1,6-mannosyltransferase
MREGSAAAPVAPVVRPTEILGLFPAFKVETGGIQVSARVAWDVLRTGFATPHSVRGFQFGAANGHTSGNNGLMLSARTGPGAVAAALSRRWGANLVLVWHVALLRLLPFLRVPRARVIQVLHGIEAWRPQDWLTRRLLGRVDLFLSDSDHTWQRFLECNPGLHRAGHRTLRLGLDEPVAGRVPSPADPPSVLMVSRLLRSEDYKGHREVIGAWPLVLRREPGAELWIAGEGDLQPDLEAEVRRRGLESRIRFLGRISEAEKQERLARCRCLVMPSRGEGFGLVYLEAMRLGRPCLTGDRDSGRELVNPPEAGLAVDPADGHALTKAICRLLTVGPEWDRWSVQARRRYEEQFTAEHFGRRLVGTLAEELRAAS